MTKIVIALLLGWGIFLGCEDENIVSEPSYYENFWEIKDNPMIRYNIVLLKFIKNTGSPYS